MGLHQNKPAYLALDTSSEYGAVVLFSEQEVLFAKELIQKMAHGPELSKAFEAVNQLCTQKNIAIAGIFCGLGPGSFVGMRLSLSFALGFSFAKNIPLMGFCSHEALCYSYEGKAKALWVIMKASGDLCYVSQFLSHEDRMVLAKEIQVLPISDICQAIPSDALVMTDRQEIFQQLTATHHVSFKLGPDIQGIVHAARLILGQGLTDHSLAIKPNYIKPPNVSAPKKKLVIQVY